MNYVGYWTALSTRPDAKEFILPKRTEEEFWAEGVEQAKVLQEWIDPEDTVLDFGCGVGRVLRNIEARERIGVDVSPVYLHEGAKYFIALQSDGSNIPVKFGTIDFLYSLMVFQHCDKTDHVGLLNEVIWALKSGGTALIQFPREGYYHQAPGLNTYEREEIEAWAGDVPHTIRPWSLVRYHDGVHKGREWLLELTP